MSQEWSPIQDVIDVAEDLGKGLSNLLLRGGKGKKNKHDLFSIRIPELATEALRLLCAPLPSTVQSQVWHSFSSPLVPKFSEHMTEISILDRSQQQPALHLLRNNSFWYCSDHSKSILLVYDDEGPSIIYISLISC